MRKAIGILAIQGLLGCGFLFGQVIVSSIVGSVVDPTGAVVPDAQVMVTNTQTGISVKATSGSQGTYSVPGLMAGTYEVTVRKSGFEIYRATGITLQSADTVRVDAKLAVSGVQQAVMVVASTPMVHTDTMSISASVTTQQLSELPTSMQTVDAFIGLTPGVQSYVPPTPTTYGASNPPIGGGTHWGSVNFTLNGVEINDPGNSGGAVVQNGAGGGLLVLPPPSALQELNIQSDGMTAQYRGKSTVTLVTKAGTNSYRGQVYEYLQNTALDANSFVLNASGQPRKVDHFNQYGGLIGGPIKRDKAFFFFDYSGYRHVYALVPQLNFPSATMRTGDFSAICKSFDSGGICTSGTQLYNPFTGQAFAKNQIPASMIASQSKALLSYLPLPTVANSPGLPNELSNYVGTNPATSNVKGVDLRLDYNLSDKDRFFGVYAQRYAVPWGVAAGGAPREYDNRLNGYKELTFTLAETHVFSPDLMNDFRAEWGDYDTKFSGQNLDFNVSSLWPQMPQSLFHGLPTITASGYNGLWTDYGTGFYTPRVDVEFNDDFTYIKGRHNFQAGIDETGYKVWNPVPASANLTGAFGFNGNWSGNAGWPGLAHSAGNSFADFLMGVANSSQTSASGVYAKWIYARYWGIYGQDTWQASPRLTLIYGLRYEYQSPWTYSSNQVTTFDAVNNKLVLPENSSTATLPASGAQASLFAAYPFETTSSIGLPLHYDQGDKNNFGPRAGFAFRPFNDQRTVIRGGYGVYFNFQPAYVGSGTEAFNPPWTLGITQAYTSKLPGKPTTPYLPDITFTDPFPSGNGSTKVTPNPTIKYFQRDFKNAIVQEWNLTMEHQFGTKWSARASYVGNVTHDIPTNNADINRPVTQAPNVALQAQRPYQPWATIGSYLSVGRQAFNQLQLGMQKRIANGLSLQSEYQFTRSLDTVSQSGSPQISGNYEADYGNSANISRHWLVFNYVYQLPVGRGRLWLKDAHGLTNAVIGGWQVSGVSTYATGTPFSSNLSQTGTGIVGWWPGRADRVAGASLYTGRQSGHDIIHGVQWFNPNAFAPPAKWAWGNSARDMLFGPGFWNWDMSAMKSFPVREPVEFQLRGDFFDVFNHFNLGSPDANIADTRDGGTLDPNSGKITTGNGNRVVQVSLKLLF